MSQAFTTIEHLLYEELRRVYPAPIWGVTARDQKIIIKVGGILPEGDTFEAMADDITEWLDPLGIPVVVMNPMTNQVKL